MCFGTHSRCTRRKFYSLSHFTPLTEEAEGAGVCIGVLWQYHTDVVPFVLLPGLVELQGEVLPNAADDTELMEECFTLVVVVFPVAVQYIDCANRTNLSHVNPNRMPHQTETEIAHLCKLIRDSLSNYMQLTKDMIPEIGYEMTLITK